MPTREQIRTAEARRRRPAEKAIERAFMAGVEALRALLQVVVDQAAKSPLLDVGAVLPSLPIEQAFQDLEEAAAAALEQGAKASAREAAREVTARGGAVLGEDDVAARLLIVDQLAHDYALTQAAELVARVSASVREAIRDMVAEGIRENLTVDQLARSVRDVVGLLPRDAKAIGRMRRELREMKIPSHAIEARLARRAQAMVNRRARTIARTELQFAVNEARAAEWQIAVSSGELPRDMKRKWIAKDPCRLCVSLAAHAPVALDEPFTDYTGTQVMKPPRHPNCKCSVVLVRSQG